MAVLSGGFLFWGDSMARLKLKALDGTVARGVTWGRYTERDMEELFKRPIVKVDIPSGRILAWNGLPWQR